MILFFQTNKSTWRVETHLLSQLSGRFHWLGAYVSMPSWSVKYRIIHPLLHIDDAKHFGAMRDQTNIFVLTIHRWYKTCTAVRTVHTVYPLEEKIDFIDKLSEWNLKTREKQILWANYKEQSFFFFFFFFFCVHVTLIKVFSNEDPDGQPLLYASQRGL